MSFDIYLILDSIPKMLSGIGLTFQLLVLSGVLGLLLAFALLLMRLTEKWYFSVPAQIYIYVFRGTPILVKIFIFCFSWIN